MPSISCRSSQSSLPTLAWMPNTARLTTMVAVNPIKMSSGDLSVSVPTEEPQGQFTSQPPRMPHTDTTSTTPTPPMTAETTTPPATTHTYEPDKSPYSKYPLPPRQKNHIRIIFNNTNSLQTESLAELTAKIKQYQSYEPTVLSLIKMNRNWAHIDQTTKPLQTTLNVMNQDRAEVTTAHYREQHSSMNIYQPGGVAQITLKPISNRVDSISSDKLG